jgi:PPOX class probable F420-dependent enzyme
MTSQPPPPAQSSPSRMSREEIETFLSEVRNIMVGAIRRDGRPQMTPNWFVWQGGQFYISTTKSRAKYANLKRDPRVQLALDEPQGFRTVVLDGRAEILEDIDEFIPFSRAITTKYSGRTPDEQALRDRLVREGRVILRITPDRPPEEWLSWKR